MLARQHTKSIWLAAALTLLGAVALQAEAPRETLAQVQRQYEGVKDYTGRVHVAADIPDIELPARDFTVYVKRPDKVKIESTGLVILPRDVLLLGNLEGHLADSARVTANGATREGGRLIRCLKLFPQDTASRERVLLWVDVARRTLVRSELWAGANRLLAVYWQYVKVNDCFWMPAEVKCEISGGILGRAGPGTVTVTFADYRVNTGLSDELFDGEER